MANKFRGEADLDFTRMVDGEEKSAKFKLVFDANAFCEIEDLTGMNMGEMVDAMQSPDKLSFKTIRAVVLGGLKRNHPELELNDAGDIISDAGLSETVNALIGAFTSAMAEMDPEQGEVKPKRRRAS
jgi:hypothetical protein